MHVPWLDPREANLRILVKILESCTLLTIPHTPTNPLRAKPINCFCSTCCDNPRKSARLQQQRSAQNDSRPSNLQAQQRGQSQRRQLDAKLIKRTDTARGRKTDQTDRHHTRSEINQRQIEGHAGQCNLQAQQRGQARRRQLDAHPGCLSQATATKARKRR